MYVALLVHNVAILGQNELRFSQYMTIFSQNTKMNNDNHNERIKRSVYVNKTFIVAFNAIRSIHVSDGIFCLPLMYNCI